MLIKPIYIMQFRKPILWKVHLGYGDASQLIREAKRRKNLGKHILGIELVEHKLKIPENLKLSSKGALIGLKELESNSVENIQADFFFTGFNTHTDQMTQSISQKMASNKAEIINIAKNMFRVLKNSGVARLTVISEEKNELLNILVTAGFKCSYRKLPPSQRKRTAQSRLYEEARQTNLRNIRVNQKALAKSTFDPSMSARIWVIKQTTAYLSNITQYEITAVKQI